jgi:hypothetical protein
VEPLRAGEQEVVIGSLPRRPRPHQKSGFVNDQF